VITKNFYLHYLAPFCHQTNFLYLQEQLCHLVGLYSNERNCRPERKAIFETIPQNLLKNLTMLALNSEGSERVVGVLERSWRDTLPTLYWLWRLEIFAPISKSFKNFQNYLYLLTKPEAEWYSLLPFELELGPKTIASSGTSGWLEYHDDKLS